MKGRLTTEMCNDGYEQIYKCTKCTNLFWWVLQHKRSWIACISVSPL